jgi:GNAT superfamily N-acetyltransferase
MDSRIIQRLDEHILEADQCLCQSVAGGTYERAEDWARSYTGSTISTFNHLLLLNDRALTDDLLSDTAAFFDDQGVPHVVAFDEHRLSGGSNFLHGRSYQPLPPQPGMVLLGPPRKLPSHPGLVIERVLEEVGISVYCSLVSELFGLPLGETARLFPGNQVHNDAIRHYVGFSDDVPVVAGTGILAGGIVSVWNVATRDKVRRQGAATALMERLLDDAWEEDCDSSLLYSSPMAYPLYQKLGYELFTQRRSFLPPEW